MKKLFTIIALMCVGAVAMGAQVAESVSDGPKLMALTEGNDGDGDEAGEMSWFLAQVPEAGMLREVIGDRLENTDSLIVEGKINVEDLNTIWHATFYGTTQVVDLAKTTFTDGQIPDFLFFKQEQYVDKTEFFWKYIPIKLRKIVFGSGIDEIGCGAFDNAIYIDEIVFTAPVRRIDDQAFMSSRKIGSRGPLVLPEGLEEIGRMAFQSTFISDITIPSTLKRVEAVAFSGTNIRELHFPDGMEFIGRGAFSMCLLEELILPDQEIEFEGEAHFGAQRYLKKAHLPSVMKHIPESFLQYCLSLSDVDLPEKLESVGEGAFEMCPLETVTLPEGTKTVGSNAFANEALTKVMLPSTIEGLGKLCFESQSLAAVYCRAIVPPALVDEASPFTGGKDVIAATLYVPVGSAEAYRTAPGFSNFSDYVEYSDGEFNEAYGLGGVDSAVADNGGAEITADGEGICIRAAAGTTYTVCGADGRVVASGITSAGETRVAVLPGLYVVKVGDTVSKLAL
mgnify:CR=1 FL=1